MLQYANIAKFSEPRWFNVGYAKLQGEDLNYLGVPGLRIAGSQGIVIIAICQVAVPLFYDVASCNGNACGIVMYGAPPCLRQLEGSQSRSRHGM